MVSVTDNVYIKLHGAVTICTRLCAWELCISKLFLTLQEGSNVHNSNSMAVYYHKDPGVFIMGHLS